MKPPIIYWFRQDLRLDDLPGLVAASGPVYPLYILDETNPGDWVPGAASRWWLHHSLVALAGEIGERGGSLAIRQGDPADILLKVAGETGAQAVHCSRCIEPWASALEQHLHKMLPANGIEFKSFPGSLLFDPEHIRNRTGEPFKVFTPFWRHCLAEASVPSPRPLSGKIKFLRPTDPGAPKSTTSKSKSAALKSATASLAKLNLLPRDPDWAAHWPKLWQPGSAGARSHLNRFMKTGIRDYDKGRDHPARPSTSRLSPHIHFGELSMRRVWHRVIGFKTKNPRLKRHADKFLSELGWREFSCHLLHHYPHLPEQPFKAGFEDFPWLDNRRSLQAWQRGQTGYPIVDAGMRELWHTGYMHNRVRMIAASFLTKHLLIPWQMGERWFWDTLVDADLANNSSGWQWVAGSGADAAPWFRIFNPTLQGEKFDAKGDYVRRWVPELAELPNKHLHEPSAAPAVVLKRAGVELGKDYPQPLVSHREARAAALDAYRSMGKN